MFDGLDMHLYVLVAIPFVTELMGPNAQKTDIDFKASLIQAAFLIGWAVGGGFFGRIADRIGRSRALMLTVFTYAIFTGLSFFAQEWWHLLVFRFLAALGIGGEWAVGASLLSETWPRRWRPWMAAVLQSAVNIGVIFATIASYALASAPYRTVFLVGVIPALLVLWIRRAVPEPEEWHRAKATATEQPRFRELFRGPVRRITLLTTFVCGFGLTAHWAFMFWYLQHLRALPELADRTAAERSQLASVAMWVVMVSSIIGNFLAAAIARYVGYRRAIAGLFVAYFLTITFTYGEPHGLSLLWFGFAFAGISQGLFGLFTMYLPPLFPTLLRTTGAGFCYNIGRIAAGLGTVYFGLYSVGGDHRLALLYSSFLFLPAALLAIMLPEPPDDERVS